jgi:hypothetical protein
MFDRGQGWLELYEMPDKKAGSLVRAFELACCNRFGAPLALRSDPGREFDNVHLRAFARSSGILLQGTSGGGHWQVGGVERANQTAHAVFEKLQEDAVIGTPRQVILSRTAKAFNFTVSIDGFSPCFRVFGIVPRFPGILSDGWDALGAADKDDMEGVLDNSSMLLKARELFSRVQASVRLRRSVHNKLRSGATVRVAMGQEVVYFHKGPTRATSGWFGGASVVGIDKNALLIKHGSSLLRKPNNYVRPDPEAVLRKMSPGLASWERGGPLAEDDDEAKPGLIFLRTASGSGLT